MQDLEPRQERLATTLGRINTQYQQRIRANATLRDTLTRVAERYDHRALELTHYRDRTDALEQVNAELETILNEFAALIDREAHVRDDSGVFQIAAGARELLDFIDTKRGTAGASSAMAKAAVAPRPDFKTVLAQANIDRAPAILVRFEDMTVDELALEARMDDENLAANGHDDDASNGALEPDLDIPEPRPDDPEHAWVRADELEYAREPAPSVAAEDGGIRDLITRIARLSKSDDKRKPEDKGA